MAQCKNICYYCFNVSFSAVKVNNALTQINFNGTNFINARLTWANRSWRNGDAQCCQLSNIADPFSNFFPFKKVSKPYLVSENRPVLLSEREVLLSQHAQTHVSLSHSLSASAQFLFSARQPAEKSSALIQLNTDIILLASLILHDANIAKITAQLLSLSYVYLIS